jgi:hypothetical protein
MKPEVTGFLSTRFPDGKREALIVLNDQLCFGYVNIPEALERQLAEAGLGDKADVLYVKRIAGNYDEHSHTIREFRIRQILAMFVGTGDTNEFYNT